MKITLSELRQLVRNEVRNTNKFLLKETIQQHKTEIETDLNSMSVEEIDKFLNILASASPKVTAFVDIGRKEDAWTKNNLKSILDNTFDEIAFCISIINLLLTNNGDIDTRNAFNLYFAGERSKLIQLYGKGEEAQDSYILDNLDAVNPMFALGKSKLPPDLVKELRKLSIGNDNKITGPINETIKKARIFIANQLKQIALTFLSNINETASDASENVKNLINKIFGGRNLDGYISSGGTTLFEKLLYLIGPVLEVYYKIRKTARFDNFFGENGVLFHRFATLEEVLEYFNKGFYNEMLANNNLLTSIARKAKEIKNKKMDESRSRRNNSNSITISELRQLVRSELRRNKSRY